MNGGAQRALQRFEPGSIFSTRVVSASGNLSSPNDLWLPNAVKVPF